MITHIMMDLFGYKQEIEISSCQAYWYIQKYIRNHWTINIIDGMITMEPLFKEVTEKGIGSPKCSFIGHYGQCMIKMIEMALNEEYKQEQESWRIIWEEKTKGVFV